MSYVKSNHEFTENTLTCDLKEIEKYIKPGYVGDLVFIYITSKFFTEIFRRRHQNPSRMIRSLNMSKALSLSFHRREFRDIYLLVC